MAIKRCKKRLFHCWHSIGYDQVMEHPDCGPEVEKNLISKFAYKCCWCGDKKLETMSYGY